MNQKEMDAILYKAGTHCKQISSGEEVINIQSLKVILSEYVEEGCVACQLSVIGDPRCSGMEHTCKEDK